MKNKKVWQQPKLIIIGEGTPEESVLKHCKGNGASRAIDPTISHSNCNYLDSNCGACHSNGGGAS